jgi:hypothetical protein
MSIDLEIFDDDDLRRRSGTQRIAIERVPLWLRFAIVRAMTGESVIMLDDYRAVCLARSRSNAWAAIENWGSIQQGDFLFFAADPFRDGEVTEAAAKRFADPLGVEVTGGLPSWHRPRTNSRYLFKPQPEDIELARVGKVGAL